jgi:hypothetical protein
MDQKYGHKHQMLSKTLPFSRLSGLFSSTALRFLANQVSERVRKPERGHLVVWEFYIRSWYYYIS